MIVNTRWLLEYLQPQCTHEELLGAFTSAGLEVEKLHRLGEALRQVQIGFIREKRPLAEAPGMHACKVEVAAGRVVEIVCASEHEVQVGWGVPVALDGTELPTGAKIRAGHFHGVASQGMICLDGEMGLLARTTGLQVFQDEKLAGVPLAEVIEIPELLADLSVLPNRPDCLGLVGIAREVAAVLGLELVYPEPPDLSYEATDPGFTVTIEDSELCPRYLGQLIRGVKVAPSPHWLKSRLQVIGNRPINNIVDVTNLVLYEWAQPLHAFDFTTLAKQQIIVRTMRAGEQLELLDEQVIEPSDDRPRLVIADGTRPVALAGIMGGSETQTHLGTTDVLLEAAYFNPVQIRKTSRQLGVRTDSSYRFERGTDPNRMLEGAVRRASSLMVELGGGKLVGKPVEQYPQRIEPRTVPISAERVSSYLGIPVEIATIRETLGKLDMQVSDDLQVTVPTWRVDVNDPVVLIEDVARLIGYNEIPLQPMVGAITPGKRCDMDNLRSALAGYLSSIGFHECRNPPLVHPEDNVNFVEERTQIRVQKPMREDMAVLRSSLLHGLMDTVERNARRGAESFYYYEIDRIFHDGPKEPVEQWAIAALAGGESRDRDWSSTSGGFDFFHMKGVVENLLDRVGAADCEFKPLTRTGYIPGQTAGITKSDGTLLGVVGAVDTSLKKSKIQSALYACELLLNPLEADFARIASYQHLARTPAVRRDLAILIAESIPYGQIASTIGGTAGSHLEQLTCIDQFKGKQVPRGQKSVAVRMLFRDPERTLTADEVQQTVDQITAALESQHGAQLRA